MEYELFTQDNQLAEVVRRLTQAEAAMFSQSLDADALEAAGDAVSLATAAKVRDGMAGGEKIIAELRTHRDTLVSAGADAQNATVLRSASGPTGPVAARRAQA